MAKKKETRKELRAKVKEQTKGYFMAALGLVAGLAWNDAIKSLIEAVFPISKSSGVLAKFFYAAVITYGIVLVSHYILRPASADDEDEK